MATLQVFDAFGRGINIEASGPLTTQGESSTFISSTYLGNYTYLERYNINSGNLTSFAVIIYEGFSTDYARAITYFNGSQKALEITSINISADQLILGGVEGLLASNDNIIGNRYADRIIGFAGNDSVWGNGGNDILSGSDGNDFLVGAIGSDGLYGGSGNDRLIGGVGNETVFGGSGADRFVFSSGDGSDRVLDFQDRIDRIEIKTGAESYSQVRVTDSGSNVLVRFGNVSVTLENVDHRLVSSADFVFT